MSQPRPAASRPVHRIKPLPALVAAGICLGLWVVLAFVMAIPSGWVHVPLAVGACLVALAIIESGPET